jgi:hypothetical protein
MQAIGPAHQSQKLHNRPKTVARISGVKSKRQPQEARGPVAVYYQQTLTLIRFVRASIVRSKAKKKAGNAGLPYVRFDV